MNPGFVLAIEGIDGAGKTTLARDLVAKMASLGIDALYARQPSDRPVGSLIREVLRNKHSAWSPDERTMALLFAADRVDQWTREVMPAVAAGRVVVFDRCYHSSLVYQAGAQRAAGGAPIDWRWLREINAVPAPDLTVLLTLSPGQAAHRRLLRDVARERYEQDQLQRRLAAVYERLPEMLRHEQFLRVLADRPVGELCAEVLAGCRALGLLP